MTERETKKLTQFCVLASLLIAAMFAPGNLFKGILLLMFVTYATFTAVTSKSE